MSENEAPLLDLSALDFRPSWAKEGSSQHPSSSADTPDYSQYENDRPPHHRDRGEGRDRGHGRGKPSFRERDSRDRRDSRDNRGRDRDRRQGQGGGGKGQGRHFDRRREERPSAPPANPYPWMRIGFSPTEQAVVTVVQQVRHTGKTFGLFEIARILLRNNASFTLDLSSTSKFSEGPYYVVNCDKSVWLSRDAAVRHILRVHLRKYYRTEEIEIAPPKGNFSAIGVCGISGVLLGPPNLHDYERRIREIHRERFANMDFDHYRSRIKMERSPEMIEKWRAEASRALAYFPLSAGSSEAVVESVESSIESVEVAKVEDIAEASSEDAVTSEVENTGSSTEEMVETVEASEAETGDGAESAETVEATEVVATSAAANLRLDGLEAMEKHFIENLADTEIQALAKVSIPGNPRACVVDHTMGPFLGYARKEEEHFPLRLVQSLSRALSSSGLRFFKGGTRTTFVSAARPRYLNLDEQVVSDSIRKILETIRSNKSIRRHKLLDILVPLPSVEGASDIETKADEAKPSSEGDAEAVAATTEVEKVAVPDAEKEVLETPESIARASVIQDLLWLTHEGYVIEYANGRLESVPPPKVQSKPAAVEDAPKAEVAEGANVEQAGGDKVANEEGENTAQSPSGDEGESGSQATESL